MAKIINGKRYDTATASHVATHEHSNRRDFGYFSEDLYKKRTGEYFLYGEGGPASKYATSTGNNSWSGGDRTIPMSYDAARQWAEKHMDASEYEAEFGAVDEGGEKRTVGISITAGAHDKLKRAAQERGMSLSALIEEFALSL